MPSNPKDPFSANDIESGDGPFQIPTSVPPVIGGSTPPAGRASPGRELLIVLLSACLALFIASGVISVIDDSLILAFGLRALSAVSAVMSFLAFVSVALVYVLMGLTPMIPKRAFIPLALFEALGLLLLLPVLIYHHDRMLQFDWILSVCQILLGMSVLRWLKGKFDFRWPLVEARHLGPRAFSWFNLSIFVLLNFLVFLPAVVIHLAVCANLAVNHFTDGFVTLRPRGVILRARKYTRGDGKTVLLFPTSHIADAAFYRAISDAVSSNSIVLLEGVTDDQKRLTNGLSYKRAAKSMGLAEQHEAFEINRGKLVRADVDVSDFSSATIDILNRISRVYSQGVNYETLLEWLRNAPPPEIEEQVFADILVKRNEHLLKELNERLPDSDSFVIPWGAAHMPGLAKGVQAAGFHLVETREYISIRFGKRSPNPARDFNSGTSNK